MAKRKFRKLKIVSLILSVIMLAYAMLLRTSEYKNGQRPIYGYQQ